MKARPRPAVTLLRNLALSAASLLVFVLLAEAVLTLWRLRAPGPTPGVQDEFLGFRLRARHAWREAGGARVRINAEGFRDDEIAPSKPPGALRILCLGDSSTFGYGVTPDETYPAWLERSLARRFPGRRVEVINAGVPGWESANGAAFLTRRGMAWKPEVVVISFGYNEQLGSGPEAFHYDYDPALRRVRIHRLGELERKILVVPLGGLSAEAGARPGRLDDFPRHLRLYLLTKYILDWGRRLPDRIIGAAKSSAFAPWILSRVYARDPERILSRLRVEVEGNHVLRAYEDALEEMVKTARAGGARPVIVLQPRRACREFLEWLPRDARRKNLEAVSLIRDGKSGAAIAILEALRRSDPAALITVFNLSIAYRMAGRTADATRALDAILPVRTFTMNAIAERTAARLGVPVVYTPLAFEASDAHDLFFPDRYHTRPAGTAIVAGEVEKVLLQEGLLGNTERRGNPSAAGPGGTGVIGIAGGK